MNRTIWVIIVIVLVILVGWWLLSLGDNEPAGDGTGATTSTSTSGLTGSSLSIRDQQAGSTVVIDSARLEEGGFVAIHRSLNGQEGELLGTSSYLPAGSNSNIQITLRAPVAAGADLIAVLHRDNGDRTFASSSDPAVRNALGQNVMEEFSVQ